MAAVSSSQPFGNSQFSRTSHFGFRNANNQRKVSFQLPPQKNSGAKSATTATTPNPPFVWNHQARSEGYVSPFASGGSITPTTTTTTTTIPSNPFKFGAPATTTPSNQFVANQFVAPTTAAATTTTTTQLNPFNFSAVTTPSSNPKFGAPATPVAPPSNPFNFSAPATTTPSNQFVAPTATTTTQSNPFNFSAPATTTPPNQIPVPTTASNQFQFPVATTTPATSPWATTTKSPSNQFLATPTTVAPTTVAPSTNPSWTTTPATKPSTNPWAKFFKAADPVLSNAEVKEVHHTNAEVKEVHHTNNMKDVERIEQGIVENQAKISLKWLHEQQQQGQQQSSVMKPLSNFNSNVHNYKSNSHSPFHRVRPSSSSSSITTTTKLESSRKPLVICRQKKADPIINNDNKVVNNNEIIDKENENVNSIEISNDHQIVCYKTDNNKNSVEEVGDIDDGDFRPKLTNPLYSTSPSISELRIMSFHQLQHVSNFTITKYHSETGEPIGKIEWLNDEVDLTYCDFDLNIEIFNEDIIGKSGRHSKTRWYVSFYEGGKSNDDDDKKELPEIGSKLNKSHTVTFYNLYCKSRKVEKCELFPIKLASFIETDLKGHFISYQNGELVFQMDHCHL
jgi:hypothetical protein